MEIHDLIAGHLEYASELNARFHYELVELSLQTIRARGYQYPQLKAKIRHYISNERIFGVTNGHTEQWPWFYIMKALKQFYWRSRYPVPEAG